MTEVDGVQSVHQAGTVSNSAISVTTERPTHLRILTGARPYRTALILILLFLAAWIPRTLGLDAFVTADERKWLVRSANFAYALAHGDLYNTYQREHPAVTNTWLGAAGVLTAMPEYTSKAPGYFPPDSEEFEQWIETNTEITPLLLLAFGRFWTILVVASVFTLAFFPLRRLFGTLAAVVGCLFVAWSPMALAFSRQLQPDGLHAVFMYAALLFFLSWLYGGERKRDIVLSGVLMGLGWLTKTPVLFLAPFGAMLVSLSTWRQMHTQAGKNANWRGKIVALLAWGFIAASIFFLLWPALWVDPIGIFIKIQKEMAIYIEGHINPNYFMGEILDNPGPLFYPIAIYFRTTPATLIGLAMAALAAMYYWHPYRETKGRRSGLALLLFGVGFTLLMTLPAKKFDRYLLPTFLVLDTLAALGWSAAALWAVRLPPGNGRAAWHNWAAAGLVLAAGLMPLHALLSLRHFPYYLTYFNPLAGGSATAPNVMLVGWGEGLDQVGRWLNTRPDAADKRVVSWYAGGPLSYYFDGASIGVNNGSRLPWLDVDYIVTYINQVQREIPTRSAIDFFAQQTPVYTATFDGIDMAKAYDMRAIVAQMYEDAPKPTAIPSEIRWPHFAVKELLSLPKARTGSVLPVEVGWSGKLDGLKVSARLIHTDGTLVAQHDVPLTEHAKLALFVPPDATPGTYGLHLLVYFDETLDPVPTVDGQQQVVATWIEVTN